MKHRVTSEELQQDLTRFARGGSFVCDKNRLLICAMPKSGSTYLHKICTLFPGYSNCNLVHGIEEGSGKYHELCVRRLVMSHRGFDHYVSHLHLKNSNVTTDLARQFGLKPVVLTRNIFDIVVSAHEFLHSFRQGMEERNFGLNAASPLAHIPSRFFQWSEHRQLEFVVDMFLPWYFSFFASWTLSDTAFWMTYEDLTRRPEFVLRKMNQHFKLGLSDEEIARAIRRARAVPEQTKMNKGVIGRGEALPPAIKARILNLADYYREFNLAPIGLAKL